jgi:hypothetical protein
MENNNSACLANFYCIEPHAMNLIESNALLGLTVSFSKEEESMVNYFLLHYDVASGNLKEQKKVLSAVKAYFNYSPTKMNAVVTLLTE